MYLTNDKIIEKFLICNASLTKNHFNSNKSLSLYDNDEGIYELYSYDEIIGKKNLVDNTILIYGKTAKYGDFFSKTTSNHISKLINKCLEEEIPYHIILKNN